MSDNNQNCLKLPALDTQTIKELDDKYIEQIKELGSIPFCHKLRDTTIPLKDMLYLTMRFCENKILHAIPHHPEPIVEDHQESCDTLIALNREGVLTIDGQRSCYYKEYPNERQRSYLDFRISFDIDQYDNMIELLKNLHNKGLNIWSKIENNNTMKKRYITMFKAPLLYPTRKRDTYDLDVQNISKLVKNYKILHQLFLVKNDSTWCSPNIDDMDDLFVNIDIPYEYTLYVNAFNIEWDMLQAESIILETIREMQLPLKQ